MLQVRSSNCDAALVCSPHQGTLVLGSQGGRVHGLVGGLVRSAQVRSHGPYAGPSRAHDLANDLPRHSLLAFAAALPISSDSGRIVSFWDIGAWCVAAKKRVLFSESSPQRTLHCTAKSRLCPDRGVVWGGLSCNSWSWLVLSFCLEGVGGGGGGGYDVGQRGTPCLGAMTVVHNMLLISLLHVMD